MVKPKTPKQPTRNPNNTAKKGQAQQRTVVRKEDPLKGMLKTVISHSECVATFSGNYSEETQLLPATSRKVAAGSMAFPWLSGLAPSFEFYMFTKLRFRLVHRNSSLSTGLIAIYLDPDVGDVVVDNLDSVLNQPIKSSASVHMNQQLTIPGNILRHKRFVYALNQSNVEIRKVFLGTLGAVISPTSDNVSFSLMADYTVELAYPSPRAYFPMATAEAEFQSDEPYVDKRLPMAKSVQSNGIPLGKAGAGANPVLSDQDEYAKTPYMIDLSRTLPRLMDVAAVIKDSSMSNTELVQDDSSAYKNTCDSYNCAVYDAAGKRLDDRVYGTDWSNLINAAIGPRNQWDNMSEVDPLIGVLNFNLRKIFDAYPAAKWLVPYFRLFKPGSGLPEITWDSYMR